MAERPGDDRRWPDPRRNQIPEQVIMTDRMIRGFIEREYAG